jgi:hypothetical protein
METAERALLNPLRRRRLRQALATEREAPARPRASAVTAFLLVTSLLLWHGAGLPALSISTETAADTRQFVSPAPRATFKDATFKDATFKDAIFKDAIFKESSDMQRMATIGAAAFGAAMLVNGAHAENSGYARFDAASDTIRILGNTTFSGTDWTYEMRIRLDPAMLAPQVVGHVVSEQRDSFEDKIIAVTGGQLRQTITRGFEPSCGNRADRPLDAAVTQQWRHMAWVRSGATLRLYVDGVIDRVWENQTLCVQDRPDS